MRDAVTLIVYVGRIFRCGAGAGSKDPAYDCHLSIDINYRVGKRTRIPPLTSRGEPIVVGRVPTKYS